MRYLFFLFCVLVPIMVQGAELTFQNFDPLPHRGKETIDETLRAYRTVVVVEFMYVTKHGPPSGGSHEVTAVLKMADSSTRKSAYEDYFSSQYDLARAALGNALRSLTLESKK